MRLGQVATQWATVVVLLLIVAGLAYWKPEWLSPEISSRPAGKNHSGGAYRAIDGDSFSLGDSEIRLHGIDAPEFRQTCRDDEGRQQPCGKMARDALSRLIRSGTVTCRAIERDRYGRQVSVCKAGGTEINRAMVEAGWAFAYRRHAIEYVAAERDARAARHGMWQWQVERPEDYRNRTRSLEGGLGPSARGAFKDD